MRARNHRRQRRRSGLQREQTTTKDRQGRWSWLLVAALVTVLSLAVVFAPQVNADQRQPGDPETWSRLWEEQVAQGRIFNDDLTVEAGQVIESDVVLYDGDVEVKEEGRIAGDLVVYSGDITVEQGGVVDGDVAAFSGDVRIEGSVHGDVASWSGDIDLSETARVDGDISVLAGDVARDDAAFVGGNVVRAPDLKLGVPPLGMFKSGVVPDASTVVMEYGSQSVGARIGAFFLRLLLGFGLALILVPIAAFVTYAFPDYIGSVEATYRRQPAIAFILGLMTGPVFAVISVVLAITICGLILVPVPFLLLMGLSFVGWTAIALTTGRRIADLLGMAVAPPVLVLIGGAVLAALFVPLWSLGSCFRFFAAAGMFLIGAFGLGAAVLPLLNRLGGGPKRTGGAAALPEPPDSGPSDTGPVDTQSTPAAAPSVAPSAGGDVTAYAPPSPPPSPMPPAAEQTRAQDLREDDFTRINGLGQVLDARLKVAGVRTYAQLAQMTPEAVAAVIGWTPARVVQSGMLQQAAILAE